MASREQAYIDNKSYDIVHQFTPIRALISYEGAYVFAKRISIDAWELDASPARDGEEKRVLQHYVDQMGTTTTVTAPDGLTTTHTSET